MSLTIDYYFVVECELVILKVGLWETHLPKDAFLVQGTRLQKLSDGKEVKEVFFSCVILLQTFHNLIKRGKNSGMESMLSKIRMP